MQRAEVHDGLDAERAEVLEALGRRLGTAVEVVGDLVQIGRPTSCKRLGPVAGTEQPGAGGWLGVVDAGGSCGGSAVAEQLARITESKEMYRAICMEHRSAIDEGLISTRRVRKRLAGGKRNATAGEL